MAAPHVTGLVALMFQKNPALTSNQVISILKDSALAPGATESAQDIGAGRIDAKKAIDSTP